VGYSNFIQAFTLVMGRDDLAYDPRIVKQAVEHFIWACNFNNRHLLQSLFINIDFRFDKYQNLDRQALIAKLILETFLKGDAQGRPFTFPLMTFLHNDVQLKLLEEAGLWDLFWRVVAERGSFYFLAHENAGMNEDDIYSFCCRLHSNRARIIAERGIQNSLAISTGTGSIGYFSINLPRLAYLYGKDWNRFTEELEDVIRIGIYDYLLKLWLRYIYFTKLGLYPFTTWALGEYWYTLYYWTVATVGTAEAVAILLGEPKLWLREVSLDGEEWFDTVLYWYSKLMETISRIVTKIENELNRTLPFDEIIEKFELDLEPEKLKVLINIEQSPAESASGKFAKLDWEQYPEMRKYIPVGKTLDGEVEPFYTSQITPYYTTWRLITQLELEGKIQKYYTGGVNKLIRIHRPLPVESVIELVETCRKLGLIYYTYVPTQNICPKCGYRTIGVYYNCPKCGSEMEIWSRIVGYYRPVRQWNPSKQAEFTTTRGTVD
ncbi:MAG: hypothetical protein GXO26_07815, partial [Crenarchaeota archaeon]|nr:hypothetical protein [Thermoproteota archaeon]